MRKGTKGCAFSKARMDSRVNIRTASWGFVSFQYICPLRPGRGARMNSHEQANRRRWDELVPIHARSAFYDLASFRAGKCTLWPLEVGELGDVAGKSLLHLQCHFGLDTLSWARRGAAVTGVDFAPAAVAQARALAEEAGLPAR